VIVEGILAQVEGKLTKAGKPYAICSILTADGKRISFSAFDKINDLLALKEKQIAVSLVEKGKYWNFVAFEKLKIVSKPVLTALLPPSIRPIRQSFEEIRHGEIRREACLNTAASIVAAWLEFAFDGKKPELNSVVDAVTKTAGELELFVIQGGFLRGSK